MRRRHRAEVGRHVDRVGDEQQKHQRPDDRRRKVPADIACDAVARHSANARGDFLNRRYQRISDKHCPADAEAELRPYLAVPIPEGSSSEAPVIRPGPSRPRRPLSSSGIFFFFFTADLSQIRHTNGRKGSPVPRLTFCKRALCAAHARGGLPRRTRRSLQERGSPRQCDLRETR